MILLQIANHLAQRHNFTYSNVLVLLLATV